MSSPISNRKKEHLQVVLDWKWDLYEHVFDKVHLPYQCLPELDLDEVDLSTQFLWHNLNFPFLISSMTWGTPEAKEININLAKAAESKKVALSLGSMKICLKEERAYETFDMKKYCPNVPLIANIGFVTLNYGVTPQSINEMVKRIGADALFFHINPLQEAVQPWWDTRFSNLIDKLTDALQYIEVPVLIKECWNWVDANTAKKLINCGINRIDVSWKWWTSRPLVENKRRTDGLGDPIIHLWISTIDAIMQNKNIPGLKMIAWGGLRDGIDVLKSLYLWAQIATAASPFLGPATVSHESVEQLIGLRERQCRIGLWSMWLAKVWDLYKL